MGWLFQFKGFVGGMDGDSFFYFGLTIRQNLYPMIVYCLVPILGKGALHFLYLLTTFFLVFLVLVANNRMPASLYLNGLEGV